MNYVKVAPGIYRRRSGRLQVAWRAGGRLHRELLAPGVTLTEAKNFRKRKLGEAARPQQLKQAPTRCTFEHLVELLAAEHALLRRRKPLNLAQLKAHFAGWRATDIDAAALERYVVERRAAGAADATIRNQITTLRHALNLARRKPEMGSKSTTFLWEGMPNVAGHPRVWSFAFGPTMIPGAPDVRIYVTPLGRVVQTEPANLEALLKAFRP